MLAVIAVVLLALLGIVVLIIGVVIKAAHALIILGAVCLLAAFLTAAVKVIK